MANDCGDWVHGADPINPVKPMSSIQRGLVTLQQIEEVLWPLVIISSVFGMLLLYVSDIGPEITCAFMMTGALSMLAALTYTMGDTPYGYYGWGDLAVFVFFGPMGVGTSCYLHVRHFDPIWLLPALFHGGLIVAVLNVNNLRDMMFDAQVKKRTIPVYIGREAAIRYHWGLLAVSICAMIIFGLIYVPRHWLYAQGIIFLCLILNGIAVSRQKPAQLNLQLKLLILIICASTCLWVVALTRS